MQFTIAYNTDEHGTVEVQTAPWVIMLWERKFKTKASAIGTTGLGVEDLAYMAWEAAKKAGHTVPISFDTFAQAINTIEVRTDDDARPTNAAPSAD